ncbi:MAG TPA: hypothetical protein VFE62_13405 [Gemmataceae bacterium]|nr:hypothetical protein [Pirellulales bacterium]HZZ79512.1 hypothetical protein [Gemmataceae bacterium]
MEYASTIVKAVIRLFNHMGPRGWMTTMFLAAALGMLWMRGFGSRASH